MTPSARAARGRQQPRTRRLGSATRRRLTRVAAAGTLAAGTGVLTAALLAPTAASASSNQVWTGGGDGSSWSDGMNWQSNEVPANGDSVTIGPTASEPTPHVTGMPGGTMLQDLTLTDASLSGGDVTVAGDFSWSVSHGIETLASPMTVEGDASFSGAGEQDSQDPMTFDGTAEINGPGLLSIEDSGPAVTNNGTLTVAPGAVARGSVCCVNPDVFLNTGTVTMTAPGEGNLADMAFNDQGSVVTGPGSLLDMTAGPGEFGPGADISGGGTLQFEQGASMTLATGVSIAAGSTLTLTGNAEFFGPGTFVGGGKFSWTGGTIDGNLDVAKTIHTTVSGTTKKMLMSPGSTHCSPRLPRPHHRRGSRAGGGLRRGHQHFRRIHHQDRCDGRGERMLRAAGGRVPQHRDAHRARLHLGQGQPGVDELQRPGDGAGRRRQHADRHRRPGRVQPGGHPHRRRHPRLRAERLDDPGQQRADPVGDHGEAGPGDVPRARELHRRRQLRLERRHHRRQPRRRQHHRYHDQRDGDQEPHLADDGPRRARLPRRHHAGRVR